jgi:hypothetical protein
MDYDKVYEDFIVSRRSLEGTLEPGRYETHHIKPRCLEGSDAPGNLIKLSYADHLFAHVLLARIHGGKLVFAVIQMSGDRKPRGRRARLAYQMFKQQHRDICSQTRRGVPKTAQHAENIGNALRGRTPGPLGYKQSPEHVAKRVRPRGTWTHTAETKAEQAELRRAWFTPERREAQAEIARNMHQAKREAACTTT